MVIPIFALLTCGCSQFQAWRHPEVAVCEDFVSNALRSPSTYSRSKVTIANERLPLAFWRDLTRSFAGSDRSDSVAELFDDVDRERATSGGVRTVLIEYDAANGFGTPVRGVGMCKFLMKSIEGNELMAKPSSALAKTDVALSGMGLSAGPVDCCESEGVSALLAKHEGGAKYVSQQVLN